MSSDKPSGLARASTALLPWAIGSAVLACFLVLAFGSYTIRAYSDPQHWLHFARDFAHQFTTSYWPYAYPLYLRGILSLAGPFWVFLLANLPLLIATFAAAAWVGTLFVRPDMVGEVPPPDGEKGIPRSWAFLLVWVLAFGVDSGHFTVYLNPYRDPLSYLLLLVSMGMFIRSLSACRTWGVLASGFVLGLACNVREPSILMVGPFFLYGILAWQARRPALRFWRTIGAFALGLVIGLVPMAVQTYFSTDQLLVPQTAVLIPRESPKESTLVPGMYFDGSTLHKSGLRAWRYYSTHERMLLWLAALGLVAAAWRRNRMLLCLVVPSAVAYAVFYAFYRVFVFRYNYVVVLFLTLLAGYGIHSLLRWICSLAPRLGRAAGWLAIAALAVVSCSRLLGARTHGEAHQIPQARAMIAAWQDLHLDATSIISTGTPDRRLCQWLDWFLSFPSCPLSNAVPEQVTAGALRAGLAPRIEAGEKLYAACWQKGLDGKPDVPLLRRTFDYTPSANIDFAPYNGSAYVDAPIWLCRISPWSNRQVRLDWPVPEPGTHGNAYWFMVDAGEWGAGPSGNPHAPATLVLGSATGQYVIPHGGAWVGGSVPEAGDEGCTIAATVESADLLPQDMALVTGKLDDPITLDFRPGSAFDHYWRWSNASIPAIPTEQAGVGISSNAEVEIPVPFPSRAGVYLEWSMASEESDLMVSIPVSVWEGGTLLGSVEVPSDQSQVKLVTPLPPDPDHESRLLRVEVGSPDGTLPATVGVEIPQVRICRWQGGYPVTIRLGYSRDAFNLLSGFSYPEKRRGQPFRWTTGHAEAVVYPPASQTPPVLRIEYSVAYIPHEADIGNDIRVTWDGEELHGRAEPMEGIGHFVWTGAVPVTGLDGLSSHLVGIHTPSWSPADFGSEDSRTLGVIVFEIGLHTDIPAPDLRENSLESIRWPANYPVSIDPGNPLDAIYLRSGFSYAEKPKKGPTFRWTTGPAEVAVCPPPTDAAPVLDIDYSLEFIPPGAIPDDNVRVTWDGTELSGFVTHLDARNVVWRGTLPDGGFDGQTPHVIGFDAPAWRPADFGSGDPRTLGVRVTRVALRLLQIDYPVSLRLDGSYGDIHVLRSGFSRAEKFGDRIYRWTTGHAEVVLYPPPSPTPLRLRIEYSDESVPASANIGSGLGVTWDGVELQGQVVRDESTGNRVWQGTLPDTGLDGRTPHLLAIDTPTWSPSDYGFRDSRTLGVCVFSMDLESAE